MLKPARHAATLAALVCVIGPVPAADESLSREAIAKRAKAATVLVEVKPTYGSGFCVHESGVFVTNEHVVRQSSGTVTLVLNAGLKSQRLLNARVVRRDKALDLALLRVDGEEKFEPLVLGSDKELGELTELIACGFPFGQALARPGEYPAISINVGSVTSLRRSKDGDLHRIQLDAALNPGNSGGPVLDRGAKVVGMVVSGIQGSGVNMAIPVSHLQRFLATPEIVVTLPTVKASNRHNEFEFTAKTISLLPSNDTVEMELVLATEAGKERRFPMKLTNGLYRAKAIPFPAREGSSLCEVEVKYEGGSVSGTTEDRIIHIGENEIRLKELRSLRLGPKSEARLSDGQRRDGKLSDLDALAVKVGKQSLRLDLASAVELNVGVPEEVTTLSCSVVARCACRQITSISVPLYIEGVSQPSSRPAWTMDLKTMKPPDTPLAGKILGVDFKPDKIQMQNTGLSLRSGNDNIHIFLTLKPGQAMYEFSADDQRTRSRPAIHLGISSTRPFGSAAYTTGYALRVQFGKEEDGRIPGKLYLCLPDERKSFIAGAFTLNSE